jgi:hypothetical protein
MSDKEVMQMALDALTKPHPGVRTDLSDAVVYREVVKTAIETLRAALAQPEPEPVAWFCKLPDNKISIKIVGKPTEGEWKPLYTAPPKREWVSLTDDEIYAVENEYLVNSRIPVGCGLYFAKDIEEKLKEKNLTTEKNLQISDNNG